MDDDDPAAYDGDYVDDFEDNYESFDDDDYDHHYDAIDYVEDMGEIEDSFDCLGNIDIKWIITNNIDQNKNSPTCKY